MKKILIVEDDQVVASAYRHKFSQDGFHVEWAPDGLEGIKLVSSVKPDIVLLDLLMPKMDGIEVLKYIRQHPDLGSVPVVVFSNSYMTNLVERAWNAGADFCLMKASTTPNQLSEVVGKALQKGTNRNTMPRTPTSAMFAPPVAPLSRTAPPGTFVPPVSPLGTAAPFPQVALVPAAPVMTAVAPAQTPGTEKTAHRFHHEADPEFQEQVRQLFLTNAASLMGEINRLAGEFVQDEGSSEQLVQLSELFRRTHSLTGNAGVAGCVPVAEFANTFEAFLKELQQKPKFINASTLRTTADSVNFLNVLLAQPGELGDKPAPAILVVDSDAVSAQTIGLALDKADLPAATVDNAANALRMFPENRYDLVILAVEMQGINGLDLFGRLRSLPNHAQTPILLVTSLNEFATHTSLITTPDIDLIAKPFLFMELTVKVVMHLQRGKMPR